MAESTNFSSPNSPSATTTTTRKRSSWPVGLLLSAVATVGVALLLVQLDTFDAAPYPADELTQRPMPVIPRTNSQMLQGSEKIGLGQLVGPEDIAYDSKAKVIYTGCIDGWIKRVTVKDSAAETTVENWVNTGGRPLGVALGYSAELYVADAYKGLLKISKEGEIEVLTEEAEGLKFKTPDGVAVAKNGIVYFTDASSKYDLETYVLDVFEGRPYGRFMSYDPFTKQTKVIARDLYYPNGVELSPDQDFVVFCETPMRRCKRYYIQGEKEGSIDMFVDNLPGMPDNIRYDGEGHFWIATALEHTNDWELARRYPYIRKVFAFMEKYLKRPALEKNAGAVMVDLEGEMIEYYHDPGLASITTGIKIGEHLYLGTLIKPYMIRLNLTRYPATPSS